jgi:starch synthase
MANCPLFWRDTLKPRVLLVASEAVPLIKTGGLADVISSLATALQTQQVNAPLLMPAYVEAVDRAVGVQRLCTIKNLPGGDGELLQARMPDTDAPLLLLDTPGFRKRSLNPYLDEEGKEYADNATCYAALAHTAVQICAGKTRVPVPHVVHGHDWHAGLIPALMRAKGVSNVGSLLTIHNLAFQGNYPLGLTDELQIPLSLLETDALEFWGQLSFLKAGLSFADRISTVSHSYAQEILTPEFGSGMEGVLQRRKSHLKSVPNGVDTRIWNPTTDALIAQKYDVDSLSGKAVCKRRLQADYGVTVDKNAFVLAVGSRMTHQKMADVVIEAIPAMLEKFPHLQILVLGCGDKVFEDGFAELAMAYPQRVGVKIGYNEKDGHALHAGADALLHGSRFEPFGLTPLYAMLYGTVPISSAVGGLRDTTIDEEIYSLETRSTGFLFEGETVADMLKAVSRAYKLYQQPAIWRVVQRNGMNSNFDWSGPARKYIELYSEVVPEAVRKLFINASAAQPVCLVPDAHAFDLPRSSMNRTGVLLSARVVT